MAMRAVRLPLLMLISLVCALAAAGQKTSEPAYFVATMGSDAWSGRLPSPNRSRTDGPFATLARAREALRMAKQQANSPRIVYVRGGFYPLASTLIFTEEDSGTLDCPVRIVAYPGETPVLSGGLRITGWQNAGKNQWKTTLPEVVQGQWYFSQLYVNEGRRYRPRLPKSGYFTVAGTIPPPESARGYDRFRYAEGDIRADWYNRERIEVLPFHIWGMSRIPLKDVDTRESIVTFAGTTVGKQDYVNISQGRRYLVENVREALTEPGEWYLDDRSGTLTYLARKGENPNRHSVVAPRLEQLLRISGARHLQFEGLTFAHTAWNVPADGHSFWQAELPISAAIDVAQADSITFQHCRVTHTGGWAFAFKDSTRNSVVDTCEMTDLGAGGIKLGTMEYQANEAQLAQKNTVTNCLIAQGGRIHPAAVGIWVGHSPYNNLTHNEIVDFYYTGISPGWTWGYGPSGTHHNTIAYNHIHQIGQGVLSDMGGIYTLGISPGTVLHHNRIHDIWAFDYGGWGIYFDEGTSQVVAENNVVYRTKSAPFHQHYGKDNLVRNNIFAFGTEAQLMRTRAEEHLSLTLRNNIVYWEEGELFGSNWTGANFRLENNLYWRVPVKGQPASGTSLLPPSSEGQDKGSLVANPRFVAPERGNFTLRSDSPALGLGFKPIDQSRIGRAGKAAYKGKAPPAFPVSRRPVRVPQAVNADWEKSIPGTMPSVAGLVVVEEASVPNATVRVTSETAATGNRSLKISDAAGQAASYNPHFFFQPHFDDGLVVGQFALRYAPGAQFYHEWRDDAVPYRVGPSVTLTGDGTLTVGGVRLAMLPPNVWVRFEIRCRLGDRADGTYGVTLHIPGHPPVIRSGIPCGHGKAFTRLDWWGFVSMATETANFFLDDFSLRRKQPNRNTTASIGGPCG